MPRHAIPAAVGAAALVLAFAGPPARGAAVADLSQTGLPTCAPVAGAATMPPWAKNVTPPPNLPSLNSAEVQQVIAQGYAAAGRANPTSSAAPQASANPCVAPAVSGSPGPVSGDSLAANIYAAAMTLIGQSTAWAGTQCDSFQNGDALGGCACAAAVSWILKEAGYTGSGSYNVDALESDLLAHGGTIIPTSQAVPGDIVIAAGEHVGICTSSGCQSIISNSSSHATFTWQSGANFDGYFGSAQIIVIHVGGS
jgi:hypothetical protein